MAPPSLTSPRDLISAGNSKNHDTGDLDALLPGFHRRRSVPPLRQVVAEQVGHELMMRRDISYRGLFGDLSSLRKDKEDEKGDAWNRLGVLDTVAMSGFGFFKTLIGDGEYNKARRPTTIRQSAPERDKYWDKAYAFQSGIDWQRHRLV